MGDYLLFTSRNWWGEKRIENQQRNINKNKSWLLENINKTDKLSARWTKRKKREKIQVTKIRNDEEGITINSTEIRSIINEYYEQLYSNKRDLR